MLYLPTFSFGFALYIFALLTCLKGSFYAIVYTKTSSGNILNRPSYFYFGDCSLFIVPTIYGSELSIGGS